ncbi:MAG: hypothetical protein P1P81_11870 [Desulfobulbales bacterium]|nr:hypothetical protein [Desulfobulbales bacterium]
MKQLLLLALGGLVCAGFLAIQSDGSLVKFGGASNLKYLNPAKQYEYGPRGRINSPAGEELFPAYPATFARNGISGPNLP